MKVQCDVCTKKEASVFCTADEAALCDVCDQRVHHANKLASKHHRFSLLYPSPSHVPLCDICQEKRAILFCQQDRAIMCRDCEIPLHTANEHTQKHNRFLLTGIKLSRIISDSKMNNNGCDQVPDFKSAKKPSTSEISPVVTNSSSNNKNNNNVISSVDDKLVSGGTTSSISEYLIEMPGWHFEDFLLDSTSAASISVFKSDFEAGENVISFLDEEVGKKVTCSSSSGYEKLGIWVPQAPAAAAATVFGQPANFINQGAFFQGTKHQETSVKAIKANRNSRNNYKEDDGFSVPQITQSVGSKRTRSFW